MVKWRNSSNETPEPNVDVVFYNPGVFGEIVIVETICDIDDSKYWCGKYDFWAYASDLNLPSEVKSE